MDSSSNDYHIIGKPACSDHGIKEADDIVNNITMKYQISWLNGLHQKVSANGSVRFGYIIV